MKNTHVLLNDKKRKLTLCKHPRANIEKHAPSSVKIECDDYNGRWRVISANLDWRSISWIKRGYKKAAFEVLSQAWAYHQDYTGVGPPYDVAALEAEWVEPAEG